MDIDIVGACYFIDDSELEYNKFFTSDDCKLWARKINALHKLRLIANHLNGVFSRDEGGREIGIGFYFETEEQKEKAIEMMGEKSMEDLFA